MILRYIGLYYGNYYKEIKDMIDQFLFKLNLNSIFKVATLPDFSRFLKPLFLFGNFL